MAPTSRRLVVALALAAACAPNPSDTASDDETTQGDSGTTMLTPSGTSTDESSGASAGSDAASTSSSTSTDSGSSSGDESSTGGGPVAECDVDLGDELPAHADGDTTATGNDVAVQGAECITAVGDSDDLVYSWTAPAAGAYRFTATPGADQLLAVSLFDGCGNDSFLSCKVRNALDGRSEVDAYMEAGQTVAIVVDTLYEISAGPFALDITALPDCSTAIDLGSELPTGLASSIAGEGDEVYPSCLTIVPQVVSGDDVTFTWTAPADGVYTVTAAGPELYNWSVVVFRGTCNSQSDQAACGSQSGGDGDPAFVSFPAQAGEQLWIVVDSSVAFPTTEFALSIAQTADLEGDCCSAHANGGCEDFAVASCTCDVTTSCCDPAIGWLEACAGIAGGACGGCPPVEAGDCCEPHDTMSCSEPFVAACACQASYSCCDDDFFGGPWDEWCVYIAEAYCNVDCG